MEGIVNGIFFNAGQVCCAGSRLLVQESIAEELLAKLRARVETLRVGDPMDKNTDVGAINSARQLERITTPDPGGSGRGCGGVDLVLPAARARLVLRARRVITAASASMRVSREEIFGPVLTVLTFRTPDEALAKANNTPYGLSAGVWTEKGSRAMGMAAGLRAGVVWDNTFNRFDPAAVVRRLRRSPASAGRVARPGWRPTWTPTTNRCCRRPAAEEGAPMSHLAVPKTYKLYLGGKFPRSESGRTYPLRDADGQLLANAARASRKDARDAVVAARKGYGAWSGATPYNRGQVIYRIAEMLDGRRAEFVELLIRGGARAVGGRHARSTPRVDRLVHYAGWTDKLPAVFGSSNPISGPYFSYSAPEPTGVVAALAPTGRPAARAWSR